ncbi:unnamed protein product [Camellia sinensis]
MSNNVKRIKAASMLAYLRCVAAFAAMRLVSVVWMFSVVNAPNLCM